jgi:tRNA1(Val) A37 N6-methylase TrmN6
MFSLVLPPVEMMNFERLANLRGLQKRRQLLVRPVNSRPVNRILAEFSRYHSINPESKEIIIRNTDNSFTKDHNILTRDFYQGRPEN